MSNIEIKLNSVKEGLRIWIDARKPDSLFDAEENAIENNEARIQLVEGCYYDYQISDSGFVLGDIGENIIQQHKRTANLGTIAPNIFVGTLPIPLLDRHTSEELCKIELEVQSVKSGYRNDYRDMLELITEKCTDLLLQANSPVSQHFEIDYTKASQTLYQKFAFIKSVIGTDEFAEAIHRIVTAPVTKWTETTEEKDIRNARRFSNANIKEILKGGRRTKLPETHYLRSYGIDTLPERITTIRKTDSVDTPENRFIKHALENFLKFCTDINNKAKEFGHKKMETESGLMIRELESQLHHTVFKDISRPTILKLNSPVLQRKEGYREVLRVWLMFDLAAKLIWKGGDDIYSGGKKDIATLYEYWLFFKLLDLFQSIFEIEPKDISDLIKETPDGLNLQIKQGKFTALRGIYDSGNRKLNIRFSYNRSFTGKKTYPNSGSWTTTLRPDYTLSFWPNGISEAESEKQELIVHVHFDAKYKIANLTDFLEQNTENDLDEEKKENRKGIYKNADLLKMHAYKDAIRRTGGAYVLYPGDKSINQKGFHEIIPGLGAFPVKPSKTDNGIGELKAFILEIIEHFINRASQREKIAYRTFDIYKNPPESNNVIKEQLPEPYNTNRDLLPDDTFVLVGYFKSDTHFDWIKSKKLYNFRMDNAKGALTLTKETISSKYLLLHTSGNESSGELWEIIGKGFRVTSKETLKRLNYPSPSQRNYLVVKIAKVENLEFKNVKWDFRKLYNYSIGRASAFPFTTSLTELMKNKIR
ncbi:MAG: DUF2357 domain-containing protein [Saprospiraceae bacterium]|nr:DUF2357 domain-containing protein [Saprospiraceae bacterium]MBK7812665.1 DUF2357 domain-containing protein [Saprospiraceae bacterium]MBK9630857.1 DUF2357 domain-containing protein [Saprospiraceae bacterium]